MQITITGPRGGGSSTIAAIIGKALREHGAIVEFHTLNIHNSAELDKRSRSGDLSLFRTPTIVIVDGVDREDESLVQKGLREAKSSILMADRDGPLPFKDWLVRHEEDIALGINDYGDLTETFCRLLGRPPKEKAA